MFRLISLAVCEYSKVFGRRETKARPLSDSGNAHENFKEMRKSNTRKKLEMMQAGEELVYPVTKMDKVKAYLTRIQIDMKLNGTLKRDKSAFRTERMGNRFKVVKL